MGAKETYGIEDPYLADVYLGLTQADLEGAGLEGAGREQPPRGLGRAPAAAILSAADRTTSSRLCGASASGLERRGPSLGNGSSPRCAAKLSSASPLLLFRLGGMEAVSDSETGVVRLSSGRNHVSNGGPARPSSSRIAWKFSIIVACDRCGGDRNRAAEAVPSSVQPRRFFGRCTL